MVQYLGVKLDQHRERYANRILPTLTDPDEVWVPYFDDGTFRARYVKFYSDLDVPGSLSIVTESPDGRIFYNYNPDERRQHRPAAGRGAAVPERAWAG